MPRPIDGKGREKWRGYLSSLEPLPPRQIVRAVLKKCKGTLVDPDDPKIGAIIVDVEELGVVLEVPSGRCLIPFGEIFSGEKLILHWLKQGQAPSTEDFRNPDPNTGISDISYKTYAPRLAERIKRELLASYVPVTPEPSDGDKRPETTDEDPRRRVMRSIVERRGQQRFRNALRETYGDVCLVTGCRVLDLLEAAHIKPFSEGGDDERQNGLLLRADIHTLFDLDLLGIEPEQLRIELHPSVADEGEYRALVGKELQCPGSARPSREALSLRYDDFLTRVKLGR
jgi:HNH endonuclease